MAKITPTMIARDKLIKEVESRGFKDLSHPTYLNKTTSGIRDDWFWHEKGKTLRVVMSINKIVYLRIYNVRGRVGVIKGHDISLNKVSPEEIADKFEVMISATRQFEAMVK